MRYPKPSGKTQQPPFVRSFRAPPRGAPPPAVVVFRGPEEPRACPGRQPSNFPRIGHPTSACAWAAPGGPCLASPCLEGLLWEAPAWEAPVWEALPGFVSEAPAWKAPAWEAPAWEALPRPCLGRFLPKTPAWKALPDRALDGRPLPGKPLPGRPHWEALIWPLQELFEGTFKGSPDPGDLFFFWKQFSVGRPPLLKTPTPLEGESLPPKTPQMRGTPGSARAPVKNAIF